LIILHQTLKKPREIPRLTLSKSLIFDKQSKISLSQVIISVNANYSPKLRHIIKLAIVILVASKLEKYYGNVEITPRKTIYSKRLYRISVKY